MISLTACATNDQRLDEAVRLQRDSEIAEAIAEKTSILPDYPADCRYGEKAGIELGDDIRVALKKFDLALEKSNSRVARCSAWYDRIKQDFENPDYI